MNIRPTSDRLRETLFNVLTAGNPTALEGTVWIELYAGTGAVGIEAISRGAGMVHFVESSARAAQLIKQNLASLGIEAGFQIVKQNTSRALTGLELSGVPVDFIFLDPPYEMKEAYRQALQKLSHSRLLKPASIVIAEHQKLFDPGEVFDSLRQYRRLVQGDAALSFYRLGGAS